MVLGQSVSVAATFVVAFGLYLVLCYGLSRALAATTTRADWSPAAKIQAAMGGRVLLVAVAMVVGFNLYLDNPGLPSATQAFLSGRAATGGAVAELALATGLTALAGVYAVDRGLTPTVDQLVDRQHTTEPHHRRRKWLAIGVLVLGLPMVIVPMAWGLVPFHDLSIFVVFLGLFGIARHLSLPFTVVNPSGTRDPSPAERTRVDGCFDAFDGTVGKLTIFERAPQRAAVADAGRGDQRWVWIRESTLEETDDEQLGVLLAQAAEKNQSGYWSLVSINTILASAGIFIGVNAILLLDLTETTSPVVILTIVSLVGGALLEVGLYSMARRLNYHADDFACRQFGSETVYRTYDTYRDSISYVNDRYPNILVPYAQDPPVERRLQRIEDRYELTQEEVDGDESGEPTQSSE